jgi:nucleotide-binding universal stress UspA family protein
MFRKIVVPLDGSLCADEAFNVALKLAKSESAELAFCSIVDPLTVVGTLPPQASAELVREQEFEAHQLIEHAVAKAGRAGIVAGGEMRLGQPADEILRFAKEQNAGTIVMGTHGRSGLKRLFVGSVAESVLHHSPCPVIMVRHGASHVHVAPEAASIGGKS